MKNILKILFGTFLFFTFIGGHSSLAKADDSFSQEELLDLENQINQIMNDELSEVIQSNNDDVSTTLENISIKLNESTLELYDYDKIKIINAFKEEAQEIKNNFLNTKVEVTEVKTPDISPYSVVDRGSFYIAKVWAGLPAIGWGYINQDFSATKSGSKIKSIKLLGSSYKTGVMAGSWTHNRSWIEKASGSTTSADIYMRGVFHYVVKGSPLATSATFKKTVRGSDL